MSIVYSATNLGEIEKYIGEFCAKVDRKEMTEKLLNIFDEPYTFVSMIGKQIANNLGLKRRERLYYKFSYPLIDHTEI